MIETNPLVSVIMSVYNGELYIKEAVESILKQTYNNFELIIINDGSTDNSEKIIAEFHDSRIKYVKRTNHGLSASLNYAVKISSGELIARMDADDIAYPERLAFQEEYLMSHEDCVMTGSNADVIDKDGNYLYTSKLFSRHEDLLSMLRSTSPFFHSSVIFRKDVFNMCGGYYEPVMQHVEDFILWNKFLNYGKLHNIEKPLMKYRLTPGGLANRSRKKTSKMISIANDIVAGKAVTEKQMEIFRRNEKTNKFKKMSAYYSKIGCIHLYQHREKSKAFRNFVMSLKQNPLSPSSLFLSVLSLMPDRIINLWKKFRKIA